MKQLKYIKIIPASKYLYFIQKLNIQKISKEMLKINLADKLIYNDLSYFLKNGYLYMYNMNNTKFSIPEGLLLFYGIKKDGIYILKNKNNYYNILIIKNNILVQDFFLNYISKIDKNRLIFEYNENITELDYNNTILNGWKNIEYLVLIKLWNLTNIDYIKIKNKILEKSEIFLISTIFLIGLTFGIKLYYNNVYTKKLNMLNDLKTKTTIIQKKLSNIKKLNTESQIVNTLKDDKINIINDIAKNSNGVIVYLKIDKNQILFLIDTNNSSKLLSNINKISSINNLKLLSNIVINPGRDIKRMKFEGTIK